MSTPVPPAPSAAPPHTKLDALVVAAIDGARAAHPGVAISNETFFAYIAARVEGDATVGDAIAKLRIHDLYLACAAANGDRAAIEAVEATCFGEIEVAVRKLRGSPSLADEITQVLRERLFTRSAERGARICEYGGRATLARWIHAVATRTAIDMLRRSGKEIAGDDALVDRAHPSDDPEIRLLKERYRADFRSALRDAVSSLDTDSRNDLRLYYIDELTLAALAKMHDVTVPTMSRRIAKARAQLLEHTHRVLGERLGASADDVASIIRLVGSRLEFTVERLEE